MFTDLWQEHRDRVLEPLRYTVIDELLPVLGPAVVEPALECRRSLLARKAEDMGIRTLSDYRAHKET